MRAGKPPQFLVMESVNRAPDRGCHRRLTPQILVLPPYGEPGAWSPECEVAWADEVRAAMRELMQSGEIVTRQA